MKTQVHLLGGHAGGASLLGDALGRHPSVTYLGDPDEVFDEGAEPEALEERSLREHSSPVWTPENLERVRPSQLGTRDVTSGFVPGGKV